MLSYIGRRLLLMIPTLLGIMVLNFAIIQLVPGGPVERTLAQIRSGPSTQPNFLESSADFSASPSNSSVRNGRGIPPELRERIQKIYGFDQPPVTRLFSMLWRYIQFDFGESFYSNRRVVDLVLEKMPVSISLGLWTTLLVYLISIPLGIHKAVRHGSRFDLWSSLVILIGYAIPSFLFAVLLLILFASGSFFSWFPLRGLVSENWETLSWSQQILDYLWHLCLPLIAMLIGAFASLTLFTKNAFLEEIRKIYVLTARSKGLRERQVLYRHVFRNALLIVIASLPSTVLSIFFTGTLMIEVIFSLDGLGYMGFMAATNQDYPIIFGSLYFFTLTGLLLRLLSDLLYVVIDPRINFDKQ